MRLVKPARLTGSKYGDMNSFCKNLGGLLFLLALLGTRDCIAFEVRSMYKVNFELGERCEEDYSLKQCPITPEEMVCLLFLSHRTPNEFAEISRPQLSNFESSKKNLFRAHSYGLVDQFLKLQLNDMLMCKIFEILTNFVMET